MTDHDKAMDKIRKLLELANSSNVNEAANAAAQAQKLMERHNIDEAMLTISVEKEEDEDILDDVLYALGKKKMASWKWEIASALSKVNQCYPYQSSLWDEINRRRQVILRIVGRPRDAGTVRYMFEYITREVDRLTVAAAAERGAPGKTWCNSFRIGAVREVSKRLYDAHRQARAEMRQEADRSDENGTGAAIVLVNNAITKLDERGQQARDWVKKNLNLRNTGASGFRLDGGAFAAGQKAGAGISLSGGGRAALGGGSPRGALKRG